MNHLEIFTEYRAYLFSLAYRMLGSAMDAEDLLQDTFLHWQQSALQTIKSPRAFLAKVVRNLCLNHLQSARVRREESLETSTPTAQVNSLVAAASDPERITSLTDSLVLAFAILSERLSPKERLVFLLREVFDYEYEEIAAIVRKNAANCRQMLQRARKRLQSEQSRFSATPAQLEKLAHQFASTCASGDLRGLIALLT